MIKSESKQEKVEEVAWNLSQVLIEEIGALLKRATNYYIINRLNLSLYCLQSIRNRITQNLDLKERESLKIKEIEVQKILAELEYEKAHFSEWDLGKEHLEKKNKLYATYEGYNEILMDLLEKYGYLINKKKDNTNIN